MSRFFYYIRKVLEEEIFNFGMRKSLRIIR